MPIPATLAAPPTTWVDVIAGLPPVTASGKGTARAAAIIDAAMLGVGENIGDEPDINPGLVAALEAARRQLAHRISRLPAYASLKAPARDKPVAPEAVELVTTICWTDVAHRSDTPVHLHSNLTRLLTVDEPALRKAVVRTVRALGASRVVESTDTGRIAAAALRAWCACPPLPVL